MGNCYHQQFQFSVENIDNFNDFDETIDISNDFEETIENFNGFEETIENFQWFWRTPSPLNVFWYSDHCQRWFFNGFWVAQPLVSMVFDGQGPLVKRWNGFNGSNRSSRPTLVLVHATMTHSLLRDALDALTNSAQMLDFATNVKGGDNG